ncbi:MAG: carboxypeptidase M32 [Planctomycetota bacterium]|jgi:carboxypeptidase Taq|nr:MAG: carboxypeptidase M32 [Planctomycetota bacterium]RLT00141.1 MAG: carboxypeptidase M32 [Planctomycetota bacterium]
MTTTTKSPIDALVHHLQETALLSTSNNLLDWDQETQMPAGGLEWRARQQALIARMVHERLSSMERGDLIAAVESDKAAMADAQIAALVREARRDHVKATKLPASLVEEMAKTSSIAKHEWAEARAASDFKRFSPWLVKLVALLRVQADCYGFAAGGERWDALADLYEPGCTAKQVAEVFDPLRPRLQKLIGEIGAASRKPADGFNDYFVGIDKQEILSKFVAESIGFDFNRGRLDRSTHPFCGGTHCNDVRMTTRYNERCINDALGSTMHESGHGIYEQGLDFSRIGTPLGEAVSLGIHESQSRLWENQVGRSRAFWSWLGPRMLGIVEGDAARFSPDDLYSAANVVEPGFIRVEADEATYNLHVMVRFEIERAVIGGSLEVAGIPTVWNKLYKEMLGLDVPDDRRGCLQDIHWSMGAMGYFPTYTLGSLYASQFFESACEQMPGLVDGFARGEFGGLKKWLNTNIHAHGRRYSPSELAQRVTGKPLSAEPLMRHLEGKLRPLYGI